MCTSGSKLVKRTSKFIPNLKNLVQYDLLFLKMKDKSIFEHFLDKKLEVQTRICQFARHKSDGELFLFFFYKLEVKIETSDS